MPPTNKTTFVNLSFLRVIVKFGDNNSNFVFKKKKLHIQNCHKRNVAPTVIVQGIAWRELKCGVNCPLKLIHFDGKCTGSVASISSQSNVRLSISSSGILCPNCAVYILKKLQLNNALFSAEMHFLVI